MGVEIERKFLVIDDSWREAASSGMRYRQGYLSTDPSNSVEYEIPADDAHEILEELCVKPLIEKTRFIVRHEGLAWEIDVFDGDNSGLVVAEIELESASDEFTLPAWAGEDVSGDIRYYNQRLVEHPYSQWTT